MKRKLSGKKWAIKNDLDNEPRTPDTFAAAQTGGWSIDIDEIPCHDKDPANKPKPM